MSLMEAILLALIEGLTEFLPVSSTAHIMLGTAFLDISSTPFVKFYTVCIQLGAILSVVVMYFKRFIKSVDFYLKLFVAFVPSAAAGLLLGDYIDTALENLLGITVFLIAGGIIFLKADKWFKHSRIHNEEEMSYRSAFLAGLFQCLSLFPGVSRSGATILGARAVGFSVPYSAEFSFFLAVPTMLGATAKKFYDLWKENYLPGKDEIILLIVGNMVSFIVAWLAIRSFIQLLQKFGFKPFGYYRIAIGIVLLILFALGYKTKIY